MAVSIEEFEKALNSLQEAIQAANLSQNNLVQFKIARDASIQRFEFCVELAWKTFVKATGSRSSVPKPVIREMAQNGFITSPELWFDFVEARNKTSHTYDEGVADQVFKAAQKFLPEGFALLEKMKKK